jgi:hypothetical protein
MRRILTKCNRNLGIPAIGVEIGEMGGEFSLYLPNFPMNLPRSTTLAQTALDRVLFD